ncbi:MAG TPA: ABC transporter permease, partial [Candidatus Saccharimonadales bacterium]|nr:ABC transporter permease [Candidatus Saccharimonadales bacterium]
MKVFDLIATANRNLTRSKLRTVLTILAIFVGGFTLTLTTALNAGTSAYLDRQLGNVSVPGVFEVLPKTDTNPFGGSQVREYNPEKKQASFDKAFMATMTEADVQKLATVDGVASATPYYTVQAEYVARGDGTKYQAPTVTQDFGLNLDLASGRLLNNTDTNSGILPESLIKPLGFTDATEAAGKKIKLGFKDAKGTITEKELAIVGVMRKTFVTEGQFFVSTDVVKDLARQQGQDTRYIAIMVRFADATIANEADQKARLEAAGNYTAVSMEERVNTV